MTSWYSIALFGVLCASGGAVVGVYIFARILRDEEEYQRIKEDRRAGESFQIMWDALQLDRRLNHADEIGPNVQFRRPK